MKRDHHKNEPKQLLRVNLQTILREHQSEVYKTAVQSQNNVSDHSTRKQILYFGFAEQNRGRPLPHFGDETASKHDTWGQFWFNDGPAS